MRLHLPESQRPISSEFLDLRLFKCHRSSAAHVKLASTDQNILMYPPQGSPWPHMKSESESHSIISDSLRPHGVYSPWNSPSQNTEVGSLSLLQGIFPTQGSNLGLPHCRLILFQLSHREAQEYWSEQPIPSSVNLPNSGSKPGSSALQADSLPAELPGKQPQHDYAYFEDSCIFFD